MNNLEADSQNKVLVHNNNSNINNNAINTINNENNANEHNEGVTNKQDNVQLSDDKPYLTDEQCIAMFIPISEMQTLFTKIYKNNILQTEERQKLMQVFPYNKFIKFVLLPMDKEMSKHMQKDYKNFDKVLYKISYRTSAVLRSLDNTIKMVYKTRLPLDKKEASEV
ncbi:22391_t:CDS:1 [Cetraspora pellucida]|uniref:22391_t:CDS:1 n=1 Tax=Cetraspora pellucida TaxID=1433469 RepID=A0A9N9NSS5_9GLOM|nr:22391_t:CDS:1 [Cetraspora pellucida]